MSWNLTNTEVWLCGWASQIHHDQPIPTTETWIMVLGWIWDVEFPSTLNIHLLGYPHQLALFFALLSATQSGFLHLWKTEILLKFPSMQTHIRVDFLANRSLALKDNIDFCLFELILSKIHQSPNLRSYNLIHFRLASTILHPEFLPGFRNCIIGADWCKRERPEPSSRAWARLLAPSP